MSCGSLEPLFKTSTIRHMQAQTRRNMIIIPTDKADPYLSAASGSFAEWTAAAVMNGSAPSDQNDAGRWAVHCWEIW